MKLHLMWVLTLTAAISMVESASVLCSSNHCGEKAICEVIHGNPRCTCPEGYYGDPLDRCIPECEEHSDCSTDTFCENFRCNSVCSPNTCVSGALCSVVGNKPECKCPLGFVGSAETECIPECKENSDCPSGKTCFYPRCMDPCDQVCGENTECDVQNDEVICRCPKGMTGDPLKKCRPIRPDDLCHPNRCGKNAECEPNEDDEGFPVESCSCPPGFYGNPLEECKKGDCVDKESDTCPPNMICQGAKCIDPCEDAKCGTDSTCEVKSHGAYCACPEGYTGNPLHKCSRIRSA